mgnify:CR=1 FL=1
MTSEHLHCVLSTDRELSDEEILRYDAQRWLVECFFRQAKDQLKLDGYRARQVRAVKRYWYWILVQLAYVYSMFESNGDFSHGLDSCAREKDIASWSSFTVQRNKIFLIYAVKKRLQVA